MGNIGHGHVVEIHWAFIVHLLHNCGRSEFAPVLQAMVSESPGSRERCTLLHCRNSDAEYALAPCASAACGPSAARLGSMRSGTLGLTGLQHGLCSPGGRTSLPVNGMVCVCLGHCRPPSVVAMDEA